MRVPFIRGIMMEDEKKDEQEMAQGEDEYADISAEFKESLTEDKKKDEELQREIEEEKQDKTETAEVSNHIFSLRTTANREDQVLDFLSSNAKKKKLEVFSVIRPHGLRGYIFVEAATRSDAEQAAYGIPYARGILPKEIGYDEIEHMLDQVKKEVNIQKGDIGEIISGPFKREKAKITRVDQAKEEVVVELLESAVPIPITLKFDAIKVIRRDE